MNSASMSASLLALCLLNIILTVIIANPRARRETKKKVAITAALLFQNSVAPVAELDEVLVEDGLADDFTVVDLAESSSPTMMVVLGVTSVIKEERVEVIETADEVEIVRVGVDDGLGVEDGVVVGGGVVGEGVVGEGVVGEGVVAISTGTGDDEVIGGGKKDVGAGDDVVGSTRRPAREVD